MPFLPPNQQRQSTEGKEYMLQHDTNTHHCSVFEKLCIIGQNRKIETKSNKTTSE